MTNLKYLRFFRMEKASYFSLFARSYTVADPVFYRRILCRVAYESDKQVSLIQNLVIELFEGNADAAMEWMNRPNRALSWQKPQDLINSEKGIAKVLSLIVRIEHGVYS